MAKGATLGYLRYILGLDTVSFKKGMTEAERDLVTTQKRFEKVGSGMASLGAKMSLGITAPLAALASAGIREAQETVAAMAQVNAALTSMGPVAGRTAAQLEKAANAFEGKSLFEADEILKKVTANLLTFGNISGQVFDRAQQAAVDLATRMGTDLQAATILVGKALNDPVKGMTALGRAGIQFTAAQKETIKKLVETGQAAKAQAMILGELERQFGGAAAAAQNADPWNKAQDAFKQIAETVGTALLPILPVIADTIKSVADAFTALSPETQKFILIAAGSAAVLGPLLSVLGNIVLVISSLGPVVSALATAWKVLQVGLLAARVAALAALPALVPFLVPLAAIALAVGAVYLAWKNWDKIVAIAKAVYVGVKTWLVDKLNAVWDWVKKKVDAVIGFFRNMWDQVVGHSYVPDMVEGIAAEMAKLDAVMVQPVKKATSKAAEAFRELQQATKGLLDRLFPESAALNTLRAEMATLEAAMKKGIITADQYAEALRRLQTEGLTDEPISVLDQGSLVPENLDVVAGIEKMLDKMPQVVDRAKELQVVMSNVAADVASIVGDWLQRFIEGTAKAKDLWKALLGYAIQALSSQNGPLQAIFGGARATGGPVSAGTAYLVGERGPELMVPGRSGRIIPNHQLASGGRGGGWFGDMHVHGVRDVNGFNRSERQIVRDMNRRLARA